MIGSEGVSVSQLNMLISDTLKRESRLRNISVTGEISGFKNHFATGHWYFSLKDEFAAISCVMFRQNTLRAALRPKDGDRVTISGYVEMFTRDGKVQLYAMAMKPAGLGSLYEQFEALKQKLQGEGLFDPGRKKVLPQYPQKVAVITSASGAALHDILNVSGQRNPGIPIVVVPSGVQGPGAAKELCAALKAAQALPQVDVIILARGGGSQEYLWCFNDEELARTIAACPVPVVSGVGHEVDFTICDYVADFRASTPSNAAEVVFPDRSELREKTKYARARMARAMNERIHEAQLRTHEVRDRLQRLSPERRIHLLTEQTHASAGKMEAAVTRILSQRQEKLRMDRARMEFGLQKRMQASEAALQQARVRLEAISPLKVLDRGYALVYDPQERLLPDAARAAQEKEMTLRFRDGRVAVIRKES